MRSPLQIGERDRHLLLILHGYGLLTTRQVHHKVFCGIRLTTMLRRLRRLESRGYITRIGGLENGAHAWRVTDKGALLVTASPPKRHFPRNLLEHDHFLTTIRIALEDQGIARSWIPEHEIRSRVARKHGLRHIGERTIPDGIMGVESGDFRESVAIELELNQKNERRYRRTFFTYASKSNLQSVWYLVASPSLGQSIEAIWKKTVGHTERPWLYWSVASDVARDPLNAAIHCYGNVATVQDAWDVTHATLPAHTPAQGVSSLAEKIGTLEAMVSSENESEELAPTGS